MFDRFSDGSRRVIAQAHRIAESHGEAEHIGCVHLSLATLRDPSVIAMAAMSADGRHAVIDALTAMLPADGRRGREPIPFTDAAKAVLDHADAGATRLGDDTVEPMHLLVALCDDDLGPLARALATAGDHHHALLRRIRESRNGT